jgi:hypothetical protein
MKIKHASSGAKLNAYVLILCFFLLGGPLSIYAQKTPPNQEKTDSTNKKLTVAVETKDGSRFVGKFMGRQNDTVVLQTETMGLIYLAESQIKNIDEVGKIKESSSSNSAWFRNPYAAQGVFLPTGIGLKKGEGNYQNLMVALNSVQYGITDNFSLGGGLEIISLVITGRPGVVYLQPKLSYSFSDNFHVSGGGYLFVSGANFNATSSLIALPFGNLTYGNRNNNITIGTFISTQSNSGQLVLIGGQVRAAKKFGFIGEVYLSEEIALITLGARFMTETFNLNFGVFTVGNSGSDSNTIPYIGFTIPFGNRNK